MVLQVLGTTLIKFSILLVIGGILVLGLNLKVPMKTTQGTSFQSQATVLTLRCNAVGLCELTLQK